MSSNIHTIYIDAAEEITAVIERLKGSHEPIVALVVPKGGALIQSIVNLKLVKRAAQDASKDVILVTTDKIGRNLATQVGIPIASNEKEVAKVASGTAVESEEGGNVNVIAGVRIHRYYNDDDPENSEPAQEPEQKPAQVIVPKNLLQPEKASVPAVVKPVDPPAVEKEEPKTVMISEEKEIVSEEVPSEEAVTLEPSSIPAEEPVVAVVSTPVTSSTIKRTSFDSATPDQGTTEKPLATMPASKNRKRIIAAISILTLLIVAGVAVSFLFFPKVDVSLAIQTEPISQDLVMTARPDVTEANATLLPAEKIHADASNTITFDATGTKDEGTPATGTVTFYNYSTTSSVTVPSGTTITSGGKTFTTNADAVVPGYTQPAGKPPVPGSKDAPITATAAGPDSNLTNAPASNVTVNGAVLSFNTVSTSGGTSKQVKVVTETDIANAKTTLTKQLKEDLAKKITDQLNGRDVKTADGADTYDLNNFTTTQAANTVADTAQATYKGTLDRIVVDTAKATEAAKSTVLAAQTATEERIIDNSAITSVTYNPGNTSLTVNLHVTGKITPLFSTTSIPTDIKGKSLSEALKTIENEVPAGKVSLEVKPGWWPLKRIPTFTKFITVHTTYE